jgi:N4-gp56 family major capsid protein
MVKYSTALDAASGAAWTTSTATEPFRNDGTNFEVYSNVVVGSGAFTHIGFEFGAGTQGKFNIVHKTPEELRTRENPYAKFGMSVLEFWNGVLIERPEWICNYVTASRY